MTEREKFAGRIRALRAKTVENGCTEAEAMAAAELLAKLLAQYNMTLDEAELRESPFDRYSVVQDDWVGERLWVVADGVAHLTGAKYWKSRPGFAPQITFFGFAHEVEVARYLLEICANAMLSEQARIISGPPRIFTQAKQRRAVRPFLDGMADRLRARLRAMKPPTPTGTGLIVLHDALVVQAMEAEGIELNTGGGKVDLDVFKGYADGVRAGDRVALNPGLAGAETMRRLA